MKKYPVIAFVLIVVILVMGWSLKPSSGGTSLKKSLPAPSGDLLLKNREKANLHIVTHSSDLLTLDLFGPSDELERVYFEENETGVFEFSLPSDSKGLRGTLTVPERLLIVDLDIPPSSDPFIPPSETGKRETLPLFLADLSRVPPSSPQVKNPSDTSSFPRDFDLSKTVSTDSKNKDTETALSPSRLPVFPDPLRPSAPSPSATPSPVSTPSPFPTAPSSPLPALPSSPTLPVWSDRLCALKLTQPERTACCAMAFQDESHPACEGSWVFDYHSRVCEWKCPYKSCGQWNLKVDRDVCCADQNKNKPTPHCLGQWVSSDSKKTCEYECLNPASTQNRTSQEIADTSHYCLNTYPAENEQKQCCDTFLKHPLSIGPRPGFPDCIGKWSLNSLSRTCAFACVSHEEMLQMMEDIRKDPMD